MKKIVHYPGLLRRKAEILCTAAENNLIDMYASCNKNRNRKTILSGVIDFKHVLIDTRSFVTTYSSRQFTIVRDYSEFNLKNKSLDF